MSEVIKIHPPKISDEEIRKLKIMDVVSISGTIVTGRDVAHKYLKDTFISNPNPDAKELEILDELRQHMAGGFIYHCGSVVQKKENGELYFTAAGPTTSIREEPYEYDVIKLLGLRGVIGKGGMGPKTLKGCVDFGAVYLHAIGGAASYTARCVTKVHKLLKEEFGTPEGFWIIDVENLECIVTMDSHGKSLHTTIEESSTKIQQEITATL